MIPGYIDWTDLLDTTMKLAQMKSTNLSAIGVWSYHTKNENSNISDNSVDIVKIGKMFKTLKAATFSCETEHCAECFYNIWTCDACVNYYSLENNQCVYNDRVDPTTMTTSTKTDSGISTEPVTTAT